MHLKAALIQKQAEHGYARYFEGDKPINKKAEERDGLQELVEMPFHAAAGAAKGATAGFGLGALGGAGLGAALTWAIMKNPKSRDYLQHSMTGAALGGGLGIVAGAPAGAIAGITDPAGAFGMPITKAAAGRDHLAKQAQDPAQPTVMSPAPSKEMIKAGPQAMKKPNAKWYQYLTGRPAGKPQSNTLDQQAVAGNNNLKASLMR